MTPVELSVGETYRSEQGGFAWIFVVLGIGPKRVRVRQSSTAGGFSPRVRLLTNAQWNKYKCSVCAPE